MIAAPLSSCWTLFALRKCELFTDVTITTSGDEQQDAELARPQQRGEHRAARPPTSRATAVAVMLLLRR